MSSTSAVSGGSTSSSAGGTAPPTSAPLLATPLKSTSEVQWEKPLGSYISSAYGDDPQKYTREIAAMHKLRQDMRGAGSTADATGRDVLLKYYGQLELLELHFPVDEGTVDVPFEWFDAFTQEPTTQSSLAFEKACVIFNLASVLARLAASTPRDIKRAYHHLQVSAGLFKFINDNFLHAPSRDLSRETIKFLADLMHTQAQEILLEKTLADKHGKVTKMAAKIAAGLAHLYTQVSAQCQPGTNLAMYMDSGERIIAQVCAIKAKLYAAHAAMHRATLAEGEAQYGEVVTRLAAAMADAKDAERWAKALVANPSVVAQAAASGTFGADGAAHLHEMVKATLALATEAHTRANKDNDVIYHVSVPARDALPALDQLVVPGFLGFDQVLPGGAQELQQLVGNDVFASLIPMDVHEKASVYSEQKASVLRSATEMADVLDAEVASALTGLGFPAALEKLTKAVQGGAGLGGAAVADELPANVQVMVAEMFGRDAQELYSTVAAMTGEAQSVVDQAQAKLDADQALEDRVKSNLGNPSAWTLPPSFGLVARRDVAKTQDAVRSAVAKDAAVFAEYDRVVLNNAAIARVRPGGPLQSPVGANEPSLLDVDNGESDLVTDVRKLRDNVAQLTALKKERASIVSELRTKMNADDISELLVLNAKQNLDEHIFRTEIAKYTPLTEQLKANASTTRTVAKEVQVMWAAVQNHPRAKEAANAEAGRARLVKDVEAAYAVFKDVMTKLTQAMQTATDLQDQCATVAKQVDIECLKRQREAEKIEQTAAVSKAQNQAEFLRQQLARMDIQAPVSPVGAAAPASPAHASLPVGVQGSYGQYPPAANPYASAAAPAPPVNPYTSTAAYSHPQPAATPPAASSYGGYPSTNYTAPAAPYQQQQPQSQQPGGYPTLSSSTPYHQPAPAASYGHTLPPQQQPQHQHQHQHQPQAPTPGSWPAAAGYQPQPSHPTTTGGAYAAHPNPPPHQQAYGSYASPAQQPHVPAGGYYGAPPHHQQQPPQPYPQQPPPPAYGAYGQHHPQQPQPQQPQQPQQQYVGYGQQRPSGNLLD